MAERWCRVTAGERIHGTTRQRPAEHFAREERPVLLPAPEAPYEVACWSEVRVQRDHHLVVAKALYSVPTQYIGERVQVRNGRDLVRIYHRGQLIKTHPRGGPGQRSTDPADYPPACASWLAAISRLCWRKLRRPARRWESMPSVFWRLLSRGRACVMSIACSVLYVGTRQRPWSRRALVRWRPTWSTSSEWPGWWSRPWSKALCPIGHHVARPPHSLCDFFVSPASTGSLAGGIMSELLSLELRTALRRLKLSPMTETLPERLRWARERALPYQDFLELVMAEECERRNQLAASLRAQKARLDPALQLEAWDDTAKVTLDRQLLSELACLRFLEAHHNVLILGPVRSRQDPSGLGAGECRLPPRLQRPFRPYRAPAQAAAGLQGSITASSGRCDGFLAVDLLILDDFGLDTLDPTESRDIYEILVERHQRRSTSSLPTELPEEWLATMSDPLRAQSAIDRLTNAAYELILDGESYRRRQKPGLRQGRS